MQSSKINIRQYLGGVVRVLWCDIPYVGYFKMIDNDNNAVLIDCDQFSNLTACFDHAINTTDQVLNLVRLPVRNIRWMAPFQQTFIQVKVDFINSVERNYGGLFIIHHCLYCFKPMAMVPSSLAGAAMYTLVGNRDVVLPADPARMQAFIQNLPNNCDRCARGNLSTINGRFFGMTTAQQYVPTTQNNTEFQTEPTVINATLMGNIPCARNMELPTLASNLTSHNWSLLPPVLGNFGMANNTTFGHQNGCGSGSTPSRYPASSLRNNESHSEENPNPNFSPRQSNVGNTSSRRH